MLTLLEKYGTVLSHGDGIVAMPCAEAHDMVAEG